MGILEQQLLLENSKQKSPVFAAILGFFLPWAGAIYNGKYIHAIFLLIIDLLFFALSFIGIGIIMLLLYGFAGAHMNYKWANETNRKHLAALVAARNQNSAPNAAPQV
jgi:TM2 domain-containing membrane protein YozV